MPRNRLTNFALDTEDILSMAERKADPPAMSFPGTASPSVVQLMSRFRFICAKGGQVCSPLWPIFV